MLKNRSWVTENAEVFTSIGWVSIKNLHKIDKLRLPSEDTEYEEVSILDFSIREFSGKIPTRKSGVYIQGEFIEPIVLINGKESEFPTTLLKDYNGKLYNINTSSNSFLVRFVFNGKSNNSSILCKSVL